MHSNRFVLIASSLLLLALPAASADKKITGKLAKMDYEFTVESFLDAADDGNSKAIALFIEGGIDVNAKDGSGQTALHIAADDDNAEMLNLLVRAKAKLEERDERKRTPLLVAVQNGYGAVKAPPILIAAGADIEAVGQYDNRPLHEAVNSHSPAAVTALIKAGAKLNEKNESGETPLFIAATFGRDKVLPLLVAASADVNAATKDGETCLLSATRTGELVSVRTLITAKADVNLADMHGNTPLIEAAGMLRSRMESFDVPESDVTEMARLVLEAGGQVNAKNKWEAKTALMGAATENHLDVVKMLIKAGADLNAKTKVDGDTPLMMASREGHIEIVKTLLAAGADSKLKNRVGRTAATWGSDFPEIVALLGGSSPKASSKASGGAAPAGKPAPAATPEKKNAAKQLLEEKGYRELDEDNFVMAVHSGDVEVVQAFLDYGLRVDSKSSQDRVTTPLLAASTIENPAVGILLIKRGADVNARDINGSTPLIWASQKCSHKELVKALIAAGADVNAKAAGGATPLMMANVMKCTESIAMLKKAGAK